MMNTLMITQARPIKPGLVVSCIGATVATFLLFQLMASLVKRDEFSVVNKPTVLPVELNTLRPTQPATPRIRLMPPPPQMAMPKTAPISPSESEGPANGPAEISNTFKFTLPLPTGPGLQKPDADASPLVRVEPRYPVAAARGGIQGWVQLSFSVDTDGSVTDIAVVAAEPKRMFEQEAIKALKRWKYQPLVVQGKAARRDGLKVQLDFNLDPN